MPSQRAATRKQVVLPQRRRGEVKGCVVCGLWAWHGACHGPSVVHGVDQPATAAAHLVVVPARGAETKAWSE